MVDLQPVGCAADHAGPVALVDEGSEPAPFPAAPDLPSLLPGALPVPFPLTRGTPAGGSALGPAAWAEEVEGHASSRCEGIGHHLDRGSRQRPHALPQGSKHWATVCLPGCPLRLRLPPSWRGRGLSVAFKPFLGRKRVRLLTLAARRRSDHRPTRQSPTNRPQRGSYCPSMLHSCWGSDLVEMFAGSAEVVLCVPEDAPGIVGVDQ